MKEVRVIDIVVCNVQGSPKVRIETDRIRNVRRDEMSPFTEVELKDGGSLLTFEPIDNVLHKVKNVLWETKK